MVRRMKTTLNIDDGVMTRLKAEAQRQGRTMSQLVEIALRMLLDRKEPPPELPTMPSFAMGPARVDVSNREALYDLMDKG